MRISRSEFGHEYASYAFGYTLRAERTDDDAPQDVYAQGFLPASSDPTVHNGFYMARSVRVDLPSFVFSSENRRILKKFDGLLRVVPRTREELEGDAAFTACFLSYFAEQHGESVMSKERLHGILATTLPLRGFAYYADTEPIAYVLEIADGTCSHYWFSAYALTYARTSLGMWLMLDAVRRAKDEGRLHCYLGTAYGAKGRYKMNIAPLSYWDGTTWCTDMRALKNLLAQEQED